LAYKNHDGYGNFGLNGESLLAHRVAWSFFNNTNIPDGMCVLHSCDNPSCCNPYHLYIGTQIDNIRDRVTRGRSRKVGYHGENHPRAKLSQIAVTEIRRFLAAGESCVNLGKRFNVCHQTISNIKTGKCWREDA
jgi:hypothetical protein